MNRRRLAILVTWGLLGLVLVGMWLLVKPAGTARAASLTVCSEGPPTCDYAVIQDAVDAATTGDIVKVAAGVYTGVQGRPSPPGYNGPSVITQVVYVSKTVTIQGGYTTTNWITPDLEANPTTLDAQGQGRVLFVAGSISPTLEGLRITGGDANGLGGGPWTSVDAGGGVSVREAAATISNSQVFSNTAEVGGGLYLHQSATIFNGNTVIANVAQNSGGGLCVRSSSATLDGNLIATNAAPYGGGLVLSSDNSMVKGNTITGNTAEEGGGVSLSASDSTLMNNVVFSNWAEYSGGGFRIDAGHSRMLHTTIARNRSGDGSGVLIQPIDGGVHEMVNTILVSHTVGIYLRGHAGVQVNLEATLWGTGTWANETDLRGCGFECSIGEINIWDIPEFMDPDAGDYHIVPGSAAIDAGVDAGIIVDMDGEPRPVGAGFDIGADEWPIGLAVSKRASSDPVASGTQLTYTLQVTNNGTVSLTATISDVLPEQVTPTGILTWTPPSILPGDTWTETVSVTVEVGYVGPLTNVVRVGTEEGATGAYTRTVTAEEPVAGLNATNDSPTPLGNLTTLTATITAGSNVSYTWAFGDGDTGGGSVVSHTYPGVNVYTAVVTALNSVSSLTATTAVTVDEAIAGLEATNDSPTPLGNPTILTATITAGSNVSYAWAFGDGGTGQGAVVTHTYTSLGVYTAIVTATNSVGEMTAMTTAIVEEAISGLEAANDSPTPLGNPTTLTATITAGGNVTYTWAFGDGDTGYGASVSHIYPDVGLYTATVNAVNSVSSLTATTNVTVDQTIAGLSAINDSPTLLGNPTTLTATVTAGSNVTYTWGFGDGDTGYGASVSHVYPDVGVYTATVNAVNSVSALTATTPVTVEETAAGLVLLNDSPTALGEATTFTATVTAGSHVTYTWDLGDGTLGQRVWLAPADLAAREGVTAEPFVLTHVYPAVGIYTALFTASNPVSILTATTTATVDQAIAGLEAANDSPTPIGSGTTLTATIAAGSNVTYTWAFGDGGTGGGAVVTHTYAHVGGYTAVVTASNSVGGLTATTVITVFEPRTYVYLPVVIRHR